MEAVAFVYEEIPMVLPYALQATEIETQTTTLYTDGACINNGSKTAAGGWAVISISNGIETTLSGQEANTTSNRMEMTAVIKGLENLQGERSEVLIYTDSKYVQLGCTEWLEGWKANGWRTSDRKPVKNQDLWIRLDELLRMHQAVFKWVKSHSGDHYNELADRLASDAALKLTSNNE